MSMKLVSYKDYVAGWLDSSIQDFLDIFSHDDSTAKYALVACLDSNRDLASLLKKSPELKSLTSKSRTLGTGLLLPTEVLLQANSRSRILSGFDEIWFFPSDSIEAKPAHLSLVGPGRMDQEKLNKLGLWMSRCSCSLALGDGEGLNFIVKAKGLARCLLGHSLTQPEPSATPFETETAESP
ncbi:MAG: hypothetical protein ACYC3I_13595 [Gemmataceae bacterium]